MAVWCARIGLELCGDCNPLGHHLVDGARRPDVHASSKKPDAGYLCPGNALRPNRPRKPCVGFLFRCYSDPYLPNGAFTFASRLAYRLAYRSQRETTHDRALRRAFKLRGKLGGEGGIGDFIPKPKWMRWPTYDRKLEEVAAAEEVVDAHLLAFVQKLDRRLGR